MKYLNFYLIILFLFISTALFAQTPRQIEADLLKSCKKISYWQDKAFGAATDTQGALDSMGNADDVFAKKLKQCAEKFPQTITYPFNSLKKEFVDISTSTDGLFRIYSWDNMEGGTMRYFVNVFQYRSGTKTIAILDAPGPDGDNRPNYYQIYTFKTRNKTYYLALTLAIASGRIHEGGIVVFSIDDGKLNTDAKIIKTKTGLHNQITYGYDPTLTEEKINSNIHFDTATQSIYIPVVLGQKLTNKYIIYKFTGQYFERVKN